MIEKSNRREDILRKVEERKEICTLEDGFMYYFPSTQGGLSASVLRIIADELDRMNADWQKQIDEYFDKQSPD